MHEHQNGPSVVLICHEDDRLDLQGLAAWLADSMTLAAPLPRTAGGASTWRIARLAPSRR